LGRAGEREEVRRFGFVEPEGMGNRVEHFIGYAGQVSALEPGVVVDADGGQGGHFFPPEPRHPPVAADDQVYLLRGHLGPPGTQEFAYIASTVHAFRLRPAKERREGLTVHPSAIC
jgi:hypothetical protein